MTPFARRPLLLAAALVAGCATDRLHREGVAAFEQGAYERAVADLERAVERDPSNLELRFDLRVHREWAVQRLVAAGDRARASGDGEAATASLVEGERRVVDGAEGRAGHD